MWPVAASGTISTRRMLRPPMSRFALLSHDAAPEASRPLLAALASPDGRVANFYRALAHAPAALAAYLSLKERVGAGTLPTDLRERIAVRVAQVNACQYCLGAHVSVLRRLRVPEEEILAARRGSAPDPRQQDALRLVDDLLFRRAPARRGLTEEEALEVAANVALNVFSNAVNRLAGTELDVARVPLSDAPTPLDIPAP